MIQDLNNRMLTTQAPQPDPNYYLTVDQASEILHVSRRTVERWIRKGAIQYRQAGPKHAIRIPRSEMWLTS